MTDQHMSAVQALHAFAHRHVDDAAAQALVDEATRELTGRTVIRPEDDAVPRRFYLRRHQDVSGISGEGRIVDGVRWPDGTVSLRWRGEHPKIDFCDRGVDTVEFVHGHGGATEIVWLDDAEGEPLAAVADASGDERLRRAIEIALSRPVPCPRCSRLTACRCAASRDGGRVDSVLVAVTSWLRREVPAAVEAVS